MIYPVKIYNAEGELKEIISSEALSLDYWNRLKDRKKLTSQEIRRRKLTDIMKIGQGGKNT